MKTKLILLLSLTIFCFAADKTEIELVKPTPHQLAFMDWEYGAFIHYGLNVYTGQEHGDGLAEASLFNPTSLDTDQWVKTAKALGAKYAVLTARHEGGFCLWPTKTSDYSIASSPYKDGKGDIVRDFVNSCRKYGIKPGLYHTTSHDAHNIYDSKRDAGKLKWGSKLMSQITEERMAEWTKEQRDAYVQRQVDQITELLTNYGDIYYIWNDHWNGQLTTEEDSVYNQVTNAAARAVTKKMRELQPHCLMLGADLETPGNESGQIVYPMWNCMDTVNNSQWSRGTAKIASTDVPNDYGLLETDSKTGHPLGKFWRSRECTTNTAFHYGGWFWHPPHVKKTAARPFKDHMQMYYRSIGLGGSAIINLPPDNRGLIPDDIVAAAEVFGKEIKARFANPIAEIKCVTKGDLVVSWKEPQEINTLVARENIGNGQRIAKYAYDAWIDGKWQPLTPANKLENWGPYPRNPGFETIGLKKIDRVDPVTTNKIRFRCTESVAGEAELRSLTVFKCASIDQRTE